MSIEFVTLDVIMVVFSYYRSGSVSARIPKLLKEAFQQLTANNQLLTVNY